MRLLSFLLCIWNLCGACDSNADLLAEIVTNAAKFDKTTILIQPSEDTKVQKIISARHLSHSSDGIIKHTPSEDRTVHGKVPKMQKISNDVKAVNKGEKVHSSQDYLVRSQKRYSFFMGLGLGTSYMFGSRAWLPYVYFTNRRTGAFDNMYSRSIKGINRVFPVTDLNFGLELGNSKYSSFVFFIGLQPVKRNFSIGQGEEHITDYLVAARRLRTAEYHEIYRDGDVAAKLGFVSRLGVGYKVFMDSKWFVSCELGPAFSKMTYKKVNPVIPNNRIYNNSILYGGFVALTLGYKVNERSTFTIRVGYTRLQKFNEKKMLKINFLDVLANYFFYF